MQHTLKIKLSYVTILFRSMQYADSRCTYGYCLLDHIVHITSFDHASNAWTIIYYTMARSFWSAWHAIAYARPPVHCKKHNSLNHYNVVWSALRKLMLKFTVTLRKLVLNYIANYVWRC